MGLASIAKVVTQVADIFRIIQNFKSNWHTTHFAHAECDQFSFALSFNKFKSSSQRNSHKWLASCLISCNIINYHTKLASHLHRQLLRIDGTFSKYNYAQGKMKTKEYHVLIVINPLLNALLHEFPKRR